MSLFPTVRSFEQVFNDHYQLLVAFAHKQTGNLEISEDIVQELFVYLYENRQKIEIKGPLKNYLFGAVFNKIKSHQRKEAVRERYESELSVNNQRMFRDLLVETEFEKKVFDEINKLPNRCREIFKLNRFEDISNDEIAVKLGISKRTVETQISKALRLLRNSLDPKVFFFFFV